MARWLSWLKRLTSNEEIPSSNLGRAFFKLSISIIGISIYGINLEQSTFLLVLLKEVVFMNYF